MTCSFAPTAGAISILPGNLRFRPLHRQKKPNPPRVPCVPKKSLLQMQSNSASSPGGSLTLADFTSRELMIPTLRGQDAAAVIQELSAALRREQRVLDLLPFYHAALNHEYL